MKVIFLDFDGVFNTAKTSHRSNEIGHLIMNDPEKVFMFNKLIDRHPEIRVVLSSSWRYYDDWREQMASNGLVLDFLDKTPYLDGNFSRGTQVKVWIDTWNLNHEEDTVERYAILDDCTDFHDDQKPSFFKTTWQDGLTQEICDAIEKHLA